MGRLIQLDDQEIKRLYLDEECSMQEIADAIGAQQGTVRLHLLAMGIVLRHPNAPMSPKQLSKNFWKRVNKNGPEPESRDFKTAPAGQCWDYNEETGLFDWVGGPCWIWTGTKNPNGYGYRGGTLAHRFAIEDYYGISLSDVFKVAGVDFDPMHQCDRPACVRPSHFWFGTHAENMLDRADKGRANHSEETKRKIGKANAKALLGRKQPQKEIDNRAAAIRAGAAARHRQGKLRTDAKVTAEVIAEIKELRKQGMPNNQVARRFGISEALASSIFSGAKHSQVSAAV